MPPEPKTSSTEQKNVSPDYSGLIDFLVKPFLEFPDSLSVHCEPVNQNQRVWIRVAFEGTDKGRVFGRGGRNIQAIRTVLETAAKGSGQSVYLDIYEESEQSSDRSRSGPKRSDRSGGRKRPSPRPNSQQSPRTRRPPSRPQ
ncbi:MAG: KH domain-containing protein [Chroococcales cyanobacterium]